MKNFTQKDLLIAVAQNANLDGKVYVQVAGGGWVEVVGAQSNSCSGSLNLDSKPY